MLNKDNFITRFAAKGYTKKDSAVIIDDFLRTLEEVLVEGESVQFYGFGKFEVRNYKERTSTNLHTGDTIEVPAYRAVHFTAGKLLKRSVKEGLLRE